MEAAALKAYQEDLKRLGLESGKKQPTCFKSNIRGHAKCIAFYCCELLLFP